MNKYIVTSLIAASAWMLWSCEQLSEVVPQQDNLVSGLKEALRVGTDSSVSRLTRPNGYFADAAVKLLLPPEGEQAVALFKEVAGETLYNNLLKSSYDGMVVSLNRAAEDAAVEAKPIFVDAITGMSISDGLQILKGDSVEATRYLRSNTFSQLTDVYTPKVNTSLDKPLVAGISANSTWNSFVNTYNTATQNFAVQTASSITGKSIPAITATSLGGYATERALNGLFLKVQDEEIEIRKNPLRRVTDLLKDVFGRPENKYNAD